MPGYRDILYGDYSENLGRGRGEGEAPSREYYGDELEFLPDDRGAAIADLGCGMGQWLAWMRERGYRNLLGIDLSAAELAHCPEVPTEAGDIITVLAGREDSFDFLHAKDVFEHLRKQEVIDLLLAAGKALRRGGGILISTFNGQAPFADATFRGDFTHESSFTPTSMAQVLRATGFEGVVVRGVHRTPPSLGGRIRGLVWSLASLLWSRLLMARHGRRAPNPDLDRFSVAPDLLAFARRPA